MSNLVIANSDFNFIISRIGYPFINESDLEIDFDNIKDICILPALHEYYKWFPIKDEQTYSVSGAISVDFPDAYTFNALDVRMNTARNGQSYTSNPLINSTYIRRSSGLSGGMYGTRYDYNMDSVYHLERLQGQSSVDMYKAFKIRVDEENSVVTGFSNIQGTLLIIWAKYSNDFSDVPFRRKKEVQDLASAYVLRYFGELRLQGEMNEMPVAFDGQAFIDRAEELEEKAMDVWKNFSKPVIIRK